MRHSNIEQILREFVDGKVIIGGSLIRVDGKTVASYYDGVDGPTINLIARDSLSAKRRRGDVFPVLGRLRLSITVYDKISLGLAPVGEDRYVQLAAKPKLRLQTLHSKLKAISRKLQRKSN